MASACLSRWALLCFLLALSSGGGARVLATRVQGVVPRQVKYENPQGSTIKNITEFSLPSPILSTLTNTHPDIIDGDAILHYAVMQSHGSEYYGARATISVYGISEVPSKQLSGAEIGLAYFVPDESKNFSVIKAGWQVRPDLYGDTKTHLFVSWLNFDDSGCFDLQCLGFVVASGSRVKPGDVLTSLSTYSGRQKYITLSIHKEPEAWWLHFGEGDEVTTAVGYWPNSIFTSKFTNKATYVEWGGTVRYPRASPGPPMGSGHHSYEGLFKAASYRNIQFMNRYMDFQFPDVLNVSTTGKDCYDITRDPANNGFYFGGPAGCKEDYK